MLFLPCYDNKINDVLFSIQLNKEVIAIQWIVNDNFQWIKQKKKEKNFKSFFFFRSKKSFPNFNRNQILIIWFIYSIKIILDIFPIDLRFIFSFYSNFKQTTIFLFLFNYKSHQYHIYQNLKIHHIFHTSQTHLVPKINQSSKRIYISNTDNTSLLYR
jgi:hypothetical protein